MAQRRMAPVDFWHVGRLLLAQDWIFAKTMPHNPHWYTLRKRWADDAAFVHVVEQIRAYGWEEWFWGKPYTMLNAQGWKHWTMGNPLPDTTLINRKPWTPPAAYDALAATYDATFPYRAYVASVLDLVGDVTGQHVLDVGCGTGWLLDQVTPAVYLGVDPSQGMIAQLHHKHPTAPVVPCKFEEFVPDPAGYDCVVSLFGAASYIHSGYLAAIPQLVRPGGRYVVMTYQADIPPVTVPRNGTLAPVLHRPGDVPALPGTRSTLGPFHVIAGTVLA